MNHTPGPWRAEPTTDFGAAARVTDVQGVTVALCYQQPNDTWLAEDNARFIISAPWMVAVIKAALSANGRTVGEAWDDVPLEPWECDARALLREIEGEGV